MTASFNYEKSFMGVSYEHAGGGSEYNTDYRLVRIKSQIKTCKGAILDLGCGGGTNTEKLVHMYKSAQIYGCDISKTAITYAKKLGSGRVKYSVMKGKKFPYASNKFDLIVCLDVLEHVPDVHFFLSEVRRILKKNGKVYFVIPCEGQSFTFTWWFQKLRIGDTLTNRYWGHIHPEFTHARVVSLFQKLPMNVTHVSYSEHWMYQGCNLLFYFLPKVALEVLLGAKAFHYSDQGTFVSHSKGTSVRDPFSLVRDAVLYLSKVFGVFRSFDLMYGKQIGFGSWKVHVLATKT